MSIKAKYLNNDTKNGIIILAKANSLSLMNRPNDNSQLLELNYNEVVDLYISIQKFLLEYNTDSE